MVSFRYHPIILLLICLLLTGCSISKPAPETGSSPNTPSVPIRPTTGEPTAMPLPQQATLTTTKSQASIVLTDTPPVPTPSPSQRTSLKPSYTIAVLFDYANHFLTVGESLTFTNNSGETLFELVLVVEPNRWPGAFHLNSITWGDGTPLADYTLSDNQMRIPLNQPMLPGADASFALSYELTLPEIPEPSNATIPTPFGYTAQQTNVVDWYPFLPPYRPGTGWGVHNAWFHGEHQVYEAADYQVEIQMASAVQDLTIAASAPAVMQDGRYRYELESARTFVFSASESYIVSNSSVGGIEVYSYSFPHDRSGREAALQYASEALKLYSELFGPYPHTRLSVVEADFLDGMEYSGMFFLGGDYYNIFDSTPRGYLTAIAVHETAHQWWYEQVGNDQALEPWLDEALCTYSERLYYEHIYPELLDDWWAFRVNYYDPVGWVNGSIYDYSSFRPYRDAVYLRGVQFLEELRSIIGDEAFFTFLRDYATHFKGQQVTQTDFFALLGEHCPVDISELKAIYFSQVK